MKENRFTDGDKKSEKQEEAKSPSGRRRRTAKWFCRLEIVSFIESPISLTNENEASCEFSVFTKF